MKTIQEQKILQEAIKRIKNGYSSQVELQRILKKIDVSTLKNILHQNKDVHRNIHRLLTTLYVKKEPWFKDLKTFFKKLGYSFRRPKGHIYLNGKENPSTKQVLTQKLEKQFTRFLPNPSPLSTTYYGKEYTYYGLIGEFNIYDSEYQPIHDPSVGLLRRFYRMIVDKNVDDIRKRK